MTTAISGTGVTFADSSVQTTAPQQYAKNKIINGAMDIAQRGTSFAAIGTGAYSLDRWGFGNTSAAVATVSQQADFPSDNEFQNSFRVAVTTADTSIAAGDFMQVWQRIEGFNVRDLIGKTFTLSFRVRSSNTGIHCVSFKNSSADRTYVAEYTVNAANTWETKSVTVAGGLITTGTWNWTNGYGIEVSWQLASGTTFQTTAGAWQTGNFLATSSQVNCLDTVGNIFAITGVQLEVGAVATSFEHRPYGAELALCQRYFFSTNGQLPCFSYSSASAINTSVYAFTSLTVPMRSPPTASATAPIKIDNPGVAAYTQSSVNVIALMADNNQSARLTMANFTGLPYSTMFNMRTDGGVILLSAEL